MTLPKVYIVDDDEAFNQIVVGLLNSVGIDVECYVSPLQFLKAFEGNCDKITNACVLLDIRLPEMGGIQVLERITKDSMCPPVIMLTGHAEVASAVHAMKLGVFDYIEKPFSGQELVDLVQKALTADAENRAGTRHEKTLLIRLASLSKREKEVLDLVVAGKGSKQIAENLKISVHTVDNHRAHIMEKLQTESVADLVRRVVSVKRK